MHEIFVVHLDLSTTNILLDDSDNVKIIEFGLGMFLTQRLISFKNSVFMLY
ncbi:hypothetical protein Patl1_14501 [Pistacia atlantica]|uniref:Uncharacterized protein n=1 Tax=Pistacia atlantica TaxID=434234 RepID=A0ACC1AXM6_9ROSI|nr:hypothetical protein Patl1_14501 [Pistacia atlantica]